MKQIKPANFERNYFGKCPSCGAEYAAYFGELELVNRIAKDFQSMQCDYCATCTECGATVAFKER